MKDTRTKVFRLLETADNFLKYARAGSEARARDRARKRYEKAGAIARKSGDEELARLVGLRLEDLDRIPSGGAPEHDTGDGSDPGGSILVSELPPHARARVPPNQRVTRGWPVLHVGPIPRFDAGTWSFAVTGRCEREISLGYDELKSLGNVELKSDFHCVTGWSKLDNVWTGVRARDVLELASPVDTATHVDVGAEHGYSANLPLEVLHEDDAILAWAHNGKPLAPKHGYPLRLVIPRLYAWKSVKWVRSFQLLAADKRGFWEVRGYHNRADPWFEERYSYQE